MLSLIPNVIVFRECMCACMHACMCIREIRSWRWCFHEWDLCPHKMRWIQKSLLPSSLVLQRLSCRGKIAMRKALIRCRLIYTLFLDAAVSIMVRSKSFIYCIPLCHICYSSLNQDTCQSFIQKDCGFYITLSSFSLLVFGVISYYRILVTLVVCDTILVILTYMSLLSSLRVFYRFIFPFVSFLG